MNIKNILIAFLVIVALGYFACHMLTGAVTHYAQTNDTSEIAKSL